MNQDAVAFDLDAIIDGTVLEGQEPTNATPPAAPTPVQEFDVTDEFLDGVRSDLYRQDPLGFLDAITETEWEKKLPFFGAAFEASDLHTLWSSAKRMEEGKGSKDDEALLMAFVAETQREKGIGYMFGEILTALPGFAIEFWLSGGMVNVAKAGGKKALSKIVREAVEAAAENLGKKSLTKLGAKGIAQAGAIGVGNAAAQTVAINLVGHAVGGSRIEANAWRRALPDMSLTEDEAGRMNLVFHSSVGDFVDQLPKAILDEFIEVLSERAGRRLMEGAGAAASKIPGTARVKAMQAEVASWWAKKYPGKVGEFLTTVSKKGGWHGPLGEFLEERAGGFMRGATGVEEGGILANTFPSMDQMAAELLAFSVPGAAIKGASKVRGLRGGSPSEANQVPVDQEAQVAQQVAAGEGPAPVTPLPQTQPGATDEVAAKGMEKVVEEALPGENPRLVKATGKRIEVAGRVEAIAAKRGSDVRLFSTESGEPSSSQGMQAGEGVILLDAALLDDPAFVEAIADHELFHDAGAKGEEGAGVQRYMIEAMASSDPKGFAAALRKAKALQPGIGLSLLVEEGAAERVAESKALVSYLSTPVGQEWLAEFAETGDRNVVQRFVDWMRRQLQRMNFDVKTPEQAALAKLSEALGSETSLADVQVAEVVREGFARIAERKLLPPSKRPTVARQSGEGDRVEVVDHQDGPIRAESPVREQELTPQDQALVDRALGRTTPTPAPAAPQESVQVDVDGMTPKQAKRARQKAGKKQGKAKRTQEAAREHRGQQRREPEETRIERAKRLADEGETDPSRFSKNKAAGLSTISATPGRESTTFVSLGEGAQARIRDVARDLIESNALRAIAKSAAGIGNLRVREIFGSYEGQPELSMVLDDASKGMSQEQAEDLAALLGMTFAQDAVVTEFPEYMEAGDALVGVLLHRPDGGMLEAQQARIVQDRAASASMDYSSLPDGRGIKFLYFGPEDGLGDYSAKVQRIAGQAGLKAIHWQGRGELHGREQSQSHLQRVRDRGSSQGSPDLLARALRANLPGFVQAIRAEGVQLDGARFSEYFGLSEAEQEVVRQTPDVDRFSKRKDPAAAARARLEAKQKARGKGNTRPMRIKGGLFQEGEFSIPSSRTLDALNAWYDRLVDSKGPVQRLMKAADARMGEDDVALLEELRKGQTQEQLRHLDYRFVRPIKAVMNKYGITQEQAGEYLYALHAPERNAAMKEIDPDGRDGLSGMSDADSAAILRKAEAGDAAEGHARIARLIDRMHKGSLDMMVDSGLIDAETRDTLQAKYKHYVPLKTLMTKDSASMFMGVGRGIDMKGKEIKRALGRVSEADKGSILAFAFIQAEFARVRIQKNNVGQRLHRFVLKNPNSNIYTATPVETTRALGPDGLVREVHDPSFKLADNVISVKVEGKEHHIQFAEEYADIAVALKGMNADQAGVFMRTIGIATRFMARMSTQWNPFFMPFNAFRDFWMAGMVAYGEHGAKFAGQLMKDVAAGKPTRALIELQRGKERQTGKVSEWTRYAEQYREDGVPLSFADMSNVTDTMQRMERDFANLDPQGLAKSVNALRALGEGIGALNDVFENSARLAAYVNAQEILGMTREQAASYAKNITSNFESGGTARAWLQSFYAFGNAGLIGTARVMLGAMKHKRTQKMVASLMMASIAIDLLNRALAPDDGDDENAYDAIPEHVKQQSLILMLPDGSGDHITIPMPFVFRFFSYAGTKLGALVSGAEGPIEAGFNVAAAAFSEFNPLGGGTLIDTVTPTVADPVIQSALNRDWAGRSIKPTQMPWGVQKPESELYFKSVSPTARRLAKTLNEFRGGDTVQAGPIDISPETMEHYAKSAFGGAGAAATRIATILDKMFAGEEVQIRDVPIARRFFATPNPYKSSGLYRDNLVEVKTLEKRMKVLQEERDYDRARKVLDENRGLYNLRSRAKAVDKEVRRLKKLLGPRDGEARERVARRILELQQRFNRTVKKARGE